MIPELPPVYANASSVELFTVDTVTPELIMVVVSSPLISRSVQSALMVVFASSAVISVQAAAKTWVVKNGVRNNINIKKSRNLIPPPGFYYRKNS